VRIARELHDVVAHHVSLMAVQAEATGALLPGRPEAASRSADLIAETARQALIELRRLLGVLRSPADFPSGDWASGDWASGDGANSDGVNGGGPRARRTCRMVSVSRGSPSGWRPAAGR
jgi:hypothetical protein